VKRFWAVAASLVLLGGTAGCGGDEPDGSPEPTGAGSGSALEQARTAVEAAGYEVRPAEEGDLVTFLTGGGTVEAEEGFVVTGKGQTIETFVLAYGNQADTEKVLADKRKEGVFAVGEQEGIVYLAPDERTLDGVMDAAR